MYTVFIKTAHLESTPTSLKTGSPNQKLTKSGRNLCVMIDFNENHLVVVQQTLTTVFSLFLLSVGDVASRQILGFPDGNVASRQIRDSQTVTLLVAKFVDSQTVTLLVVNSWIPRR